MPLIFLPNDQDQSEVDENCEDTGDAQMSSFGLMSFAMAMVNAVTVSYTHLRAHET